MEIFRCERYVKLEIQQLLTGHSGQIETAIYSPDGNTLAVAVGSYIHLLDIQSETNRHTLSSHTNFVSSIAFSPDGQHLLTGSWDNTAKIWNCQTGQLLHTFKDHTNWVRSVAFSTNETLIFTGSENEVRIWDSKTYTCLGSLKSQEGAVVSIASNPKGQQLILGSGCNAYICNFKKKNTFV